MAFNHHAPILKVVDLKEGDSIETETRTILESDVHAFCGLVGDTNPIHLSDVAARNSQWGDILVPATLTAAMAIALFGSTRWLHAILMPFVGMTDLKVEGPVFPKDTISVTVTVMEKRLTSDGKRYVLGLKMEVYAENSGANSHAGAGKRKVITFFPKFMIQDR